MAPLLYINSPQPTSNLVTLHPGLYFRLYHHPPGHVFPHNHSKVLFVKKRCYPIPIIDMLKQCFQCYIPPWLIFPLLPPSTRTRVSSKSRRGVFFQNSSHLISVIEMLKQYFQFNECNNKQKRIMIIFVIHTVD